MKKKGQENRMKMANAIVGQSGGPTSVINSSLAGVIKKSFKSKCIENIYGMKYGIEGFIREKIIDLGSQPDKVINDLKNTPSSILGSSRYKINDEDLPGILSILKKYNIRYFFLIGGNDSMDTVNRIEGFSRKEGYELIGIGIPKTVDNDLYGTDHTPGFPSAAKYNILSVMQSGILARDMQKVDKFVVYQTIGRDAGWLAASAALAKKNEEDAPHLIYTPEVPFIKDNFLSDAEKCIKKYGWVSIVCGEGIKYKDSTPVCLSQTKDRFNNIEYGAMGGTGTGMALHGFMKEEFGFRGEFQITESLIMCAIDRAVSFDIEEAYQCGKNAVELAEKGESGFMITIKRVSNNPYKGKYGKIPLNEVAIKAKPMPLDFINKEGNFVTKNFYDYMSLLVSDIPNYTVLEKIS